MSKTKTHGRKLKLAKADKTASPAPRWLDIKIFGLKKARFRSLKRFRTRTWKKGAKLQV